MWWYNKKQFLTTDSYLNFGSFRATFLIKKDMVVWKESGANMFSALDGTYHAAQGEFYYFQCSDHFSSVLLADYIPFVRNSNRFSDVAGALENALSRLNKVVQEYKSDIPQRVRYLYYEGLASPTVYVLRSSLDGVGTLHNIERRGKKYVIKMTGSPSRYWLGSDEPPEWVNVEMPQ